MALSLALASSAVLLLLAPAAAITPQGCYSVFQSPGLCDSTAPRRLDACFTLCGACTTPEIALWLPESFAAVCTTTPYTLDTAAITAATTAAVLEAARIQGTFWLDDEANATAALSFLIGHMPRRDLMMLFSKPLDTIEWLTEGVRLALRTWDWAAARGVDFPTFMEYVVPYAVLDEKRDMAFNWRPRMYQVCSPPILSTQSDSPGIGKCIFGVTQPVFTKKWGACDGNMYSCRWSGRLTHPTIPSGRLLLPGRTLPINYSTTTTPALIFLFFYYGYD